MLLPILIFQSLVLDECVVKHSRKLPPKVSLFSTSKANGKFIFMSSHFFYIMVFFLLSSLENDAIVGTYQPLRVICFTYFNANL